MSTIDAAYMASMLVSYDRATKDALYAKQQSQIDNQTKGLTTLKTKLTEFQTVMKDLNKATSLQAQKASISQEGYLSISSNGTAISGQYNFFVKQLAQSHQVGMSFGSETDALPTEGVLELSIGDKTTSIDFSTLPEGATVKDLVNAINKASDNPGLKASLVRSGDQVNLVLTSQSTGASNAIAINYSAGSSAESERFGQIVDNRTDITLAQDAVVEMGGTNPITITSSTNKLDNLVDGLTIELTRAQVEGEAPLQVTVAQDNDAITESLNKFIDSYNGLMDELKTLSKNSVDDEGLLAGDSTVRSLMSQLRNGVRNLSNGVVLSDLGIKTDKDGKLSLDSAAFAKALENDPELVGKALLGNDGPLKQLEEMTKVYTKTGGTISLRQDSLQSSQSRLDDRMDAHERRMEAAYNRYLSQYTRLNNLITQMSQTSSMFY